MRNQAIFRTGIPKLQQNSSHADTKQKIPVDVDKNININNHFISKVENVKYLE